MKDLRDYRVSLKFSEKDADHIAVVKLLKQLGRKKSAFIVKAVKYYMENNPMPEVPGSNPVVTNMITEAVVKATILKMLQAGELPNSINTSLLQQIPQPVQTEKFEASEVLKQSEDKPKKEIEPPKYIPPKKSKPVKVEPSEEDYIDEESSPKEDPVDTASGEAVNDMLSMLDEF